MLILKCKRDEAMIYLDNAATTKVCDTAKDACIYAISEVWGNPSSLHGLGIAAEKIMQNSKEHISKAIGCMSDEIYFTSGATESNNTAILGLCETYGRRKKKVVTSAVEHPSVLQPFEKLKARGYEVTIVYPDSNGIISADALIDAVDDNTCLISAMLVNNENGYILPIEKAFKEIKAEYPDCMTHCDCVQGFEKLPVKVKSLCCDTMSLSGHKIYAPKGVGALFVKKGVRVAPLIIGGGQQKNLRAGTESIPLIYSFGETVKELTPTISERFEKVKAVNDYARKKLSQLDGIVVNSPENSSPYILNFSVCGFKSETILHYLESFEIYVSSGSACSRGKKSSVLKAFGLSDKLIDSAIRISFSMDTEKADIDALCDRLAEATATLAKASKH